MKIPSQLTRILSSPISVFISFLFPSYCYGCKKEGISLCDTCLVSSAKAINSPYPFIVSLYSFKDPLIKKSIHAIKYFHRKDLILPFAKHLAHEIKKDTTSTTLLIPIPMPTYRKCIRGYNHAEALAKEISKITHTPYSSTILLKKSGSTRQVATTSRTSRLKSQRNTFLVRARVDGRHIILIDDVATTGATLSEARRILLENGAVSVQAYTIAH
jgi:competence protein ComFC